MPDTLASCPHGVLLYGGRCINCERKTLDQLTCVKCGGTYHEAALPADEVRFQCVCPSCRPTDRTVRIDTWA